ncbi:lytic transglycosylase domain-containing protein [Ideonella sp. TBM-1]|uniref:Lytic transglycosylase domain-containing protein n=2 Tax=Ideonella livida TaxID=2707176 RepID=A0A7C9TJ18_9BURK|nr:lytic transglycosylase domain-containing protein [Ideonella livida]
MATNGKNATRVFLTDVGHGLLEVSHNMLAMLGLLVLALGLLVLGRADLRAQAEESIFAWLQAREAARVADAGVYSLPEDAEVAQLAKALAADPSSLDKQQAAVTQWLARRYRVAPEPVARLVKEAWQVGGKVRLEPTLILAIVAIESSFNPFAQSPVGAQGLMQVMTHVHNDKYEAFGGRLAAFDPVTNLRVGVQVLKECIARAGSLEAGLRFYVGAANLEDDGGYAHRVLTEQRHLSAVASGRKIPVNVPNVVPEAAPAAPNGPLAQADLSLSWDKAGSEARLAR